MSLYSSLTVKEGVILNSDACDHAGTAAMTKATIMKRDARCNSDHDDAAKIGIIVERGHDIRECLPRRLTSPHCLGVLSDTAPPSQSQLWLRGLMCVSIDASCSKLRGMRSLLDSDEQPNRFPLQPLQHRRISPRINGPKRLPSKDLADRHVSSRSSALTFVPTLLPRISIFTINR